MLFFSKTKRFPGKESGGGLFQLLFILEGIFELCELVGGSSLLIMDNLKTTLYTMEKHENRQQNCNWLIWHASRYHNLAALVSCHVLVKK